MFQDKKNVIEDDEEKKYEGESRGGIKFYYKRDQNKGVANIKACQRARILVSGHHMMTNYDSHFTQALKMLCEISHKITRCSDTVHCDLQLRHEDQCLQI